MTYTRKSFSGNASPTTLTGSITSGATTIVVAAILNWPNTTDGPFIVTIDRGTTNEEKVKIASYTGTTLTVASGGRGWDGTTAAAHGASADIRCTIDADTINNHESFVAGNGTVTPTTSAIGDLASGGTSAFPAAGDHKHARENFVVGATTASAPGDAESDGASVSPARADHKHAREAFGGSAPPKASGTGGTGSALTLARSDHFHPVDGAPLGLTGASGATRYVGATASGKPTTGTFAAGDFVIDQTGVVWVCTTLGTPGTWARVGPTGNPAGRLYGTTENVWTNGSLTQTSLTQDFVKGGMVKTGDTLVVPVAGIYQVSASLTYESNGTGVPAGDYEVQVFQNGTQVRTHLVALTATSGAPITASLSDTINCAASDAFALVGFISNGSNEIGTCRSGIAFGSNSNYLSLTLVSQ